MAVNGDAAVIGKPHRENHNTSPLVTRTTRTSGGVITASPKAVTDQKNSTLKEGYSSATMYHKP
jgi:hypothetical protein